MQLGIVPGPCSLPRTLLVDAASGFQGGSWSKPKLPCWPEARDQGWLQSHEVSQWLKVIQSSGCYSASGMRRPFPFHLYTPSLPLSFPDPVSDSGRP